MAKKGMRRYKPGDGMDSDKHYNKNKNDVKPVPELQGKARESKEKAKPVE